MSVPGPSLLLHQVSRRMHQSPNLCGQGQCCLWCQSRGLDPPLSASIARPGLSRRLTCLTAVRRFSGQMLQSRTPSFSLPDASDSSVYLTVMMSPCSMRLSSLVLSLLPVLSNRYRALKDARVGLGLLKSNPSRLSLRLRSVLRDRFRSSVCCWMTCRHLSRQLPRLS